MTRLPNLLNYSLILVAILASHAAAIRLLDADWEDVELGQPFALRWADEGQDGVNIFLSQGPATNLVRVSQLGTNVTTAAGAAWTVTLSGLPEGEYAFEVEDVESGDVASSPVFDLDPDDEEDGVPITSLQPLPTTSSTSQEPASTTAETTSSEGTTATSNPTSSGTQSEGTTPTTSGERETGTGTPDSGSGSDGLSTGAKIGIGVGAGIGGLLILAAIAWFFYRRGQKSPRHELEAEAGVGAGAAAGTAAVAEKKHDAGAPMAAELTGNSIAEMPDNQYGTHLRPGELSSAEVRGGGEGYDRGTVGRSELP